MMLQIQINYTPEKLLSHSISAVSLLLRKEKLYKIWNRLVAGNVLSLCTAQGQDRPFEAENSCGICVCMLQLTMDDASFKAAAQSPNATAA